MRLIDLLTAALTISYPVAVYFGLQSLEPRVFGILLLFILLLRHARLLRSLVTSLNRSDWLALLTLGILSAAITVFNSETLLRLYPACVNLIMLATFTKTLFAPPTMIERFARLSKPDLSPAGVLYTRRVTQVWCLFFFANGIVAAASAFSTREWWLIYNGLIAYLLIGILFSGEWLIRKWFIDRENRAV